MNIDKPQCNLKTCRYCHDHNCFGQYETCEYTLAKNDRPHGEWIPCSERLPEEHGYYLVQTDGSHNDVIDIAEYGMYKKLVWGWNKASEVIAWMPLPDPYNGGEAE